MSARLITAVVILLKEFVSILLEATTVPVKGDMNSKKTVNSSVKVSGGKFHSCKKLLLGHRFQVEGH